MRQYFFAGIIAKVRTERNREERQEIVALDARTPGNDQIRQRKEATIIMPSGEVAKGVHPNQKVELVVGIERAQALKNLDRIALAGKRSFQIRDTKGWIAGNGKRDHSQALRKRGRLVRQRLVGRIGGRQEEDLIEATMFAGFFRQTQMREMNRIKGAAKDAEALPPPRPVQIGRPPASARRLAAVRRRRSVVSQPIHLSVIDTP